MWSVPPPTKEVAAHTHNVTRVEHPTALPEAIQDIFKAFPDVIFHTLPKNSPLFPVLPEQYIGLAATGNAPVTDEYLLSALHRARLTKDDAELALIQKANEISSRAHETVMRVLGQGVIGAIKRAKGAGIDRPLLPSEWLIQKEAEAEALFVASCRREGSVHLSTLRVMFCITHCYDAVGLSIKHICQLSQGRTEHQHYITVAMIKTLHGALLANMIISIITTLNMITPKSYILKSCLLMLVVNGTVTLRTVSPVPV